LPQYGGSFTYRRAADTQSFDPYQGDNAITKLWYDTMTMANLTIDRKVFDFKIGGTPMEFMTGSLAESWETPDMATFIFHIRKGVRWQDVPPVSGRELTAYDLEYSFHRQLGLGSGFTKSSPNIGITNYTLITSVTATDKYTLIFKLKELSLETLKYLIGHDGTTDATVAREAVEKWGNLNDWKCQIGTGAFIIEDYVSNASITARRNPNYWGYDELYPKNRLPYLDEVRVLFIPDNATSYAALRTGKIDIVENIPWEQSAALARTNPELKQATRPQNGFGIFLRVDQKPFDNIKVRKAMQMAIDIKTIASTYYGGYAVSTPMGAIGITGYYLPFDQWPQEDKDGYTYNPAGAKKLLAEAGYPNGFKTTMTVRSSDDQSLLQVFKGYFSNVGIDMEIQVLDAAAFTAYTRADKHVMMTGTGTTVLFAPLTILNKFYSTYQLYRHHIKDPVYDKLVDQFYSSLDVEEARKIAIKADAYATSQYFGINLPPYFNTVVSQPWLKRFNGELPTVIGGPLGNLTANFWVDQNLRKAMGR
jgi:peptide/nickel transport system substrate-binding protein